MRRAVHHVPLPHEWKALDGEHRRTGDGEALGPIGRGAKTVIDIYHRNARRAPMNSVARIASPVGITTTMRTARSLSDLFHLKNVLSADFR